MKAPELESKDSIISYSIPVTCVRKVNSSFLEGLDSALMPQFTGTIFKLNCLIKVTPMMPDYSYACWYSKVMFFFTMESGIIIFYSPSTLIANCTETDRNNEQTQTGFFLFQHFITIIYIVISMTGLHILSKGLCGPWQVKLSVST